MTRPTLTTNAPGNTLLAALRAAAPAPPPATRGLHEPAPALAEIAIATGFVTPAGFCALADQLRQAARVRLLLGTEPEPEAARVLRRPGDPPPAAFARRAMARALETLDAGLRRTRDRVAFTPEGRDQLRMTVAMLRAGPIETRRHEAGPLPARAMLLDGFDPMLVVGASNLTLGGLEAAPALNLTLPDAPVFAQARAWFDALWAAAAPFDLAALFEEPDQEFPPWLIFLRILWQLYGEELEQERRDVGDIQLTEFQRHGVWRAERILREFGGVLIADEVGLGKTYIAGQILDAFGKSGRRALLICPAVLRDTTWERFKNAHNLGSYIDIVSFDQLARDRRLADPRRPLAQHRHLRFDPEQYRLVVVDEAHNYRHEHAPYRAAVLHDLLRGSTHKDLVLLTATPVNNSLWDLYNLMRLFLRQDGALASRGIVGIKERFRAAARQDPSDLSPDFLFPIIDAVTVKRTRAFVRTHYAHDEITGPDGVKRPIVFPKAVLHSVRYDLDAAAPGLFDAVADALDPERGTGLIAFARYAPGAFRLEREEDAAESPEAAAGLLRSGLLKRFESSAHAFRTSLARMVGEHDAFLAALDRGRVIDTAFLHELGADEDAFDDLLDGSETAEDAHLFDTAGLRAAVVRDHAILHDLAQRLAALPEDADAKLAAVTDALAAIATEARADAASDTEETRNRKVLLFSQYADTVAWLRHALAARIDADPRLAAYRGRIVAVAGRGLEAEDASRTEAAWGFAPETADAPPGTPDRYDLLISTDVLAEGVNLQQCRHIINYDLPWNPMRLVQRHGRIDRIGSRHPRVFLRTVFPGDRLNALLTLQERIHRKLAQAARSIGVATPPVEGPEAGAHVFAETRAEIERLAQEDPTLFERGGTPAAAQSGEEYRHRLRAALQADRAAIEDLPGRAGSGLHRGTATGIVFCAEVEGVDGRRSFLRFVPARPGWQPADPAAIRREIGTCLRLTDCGPEAPRHLPAALGDQVFAFWAAARDDILREWEALTDPANLQPTVRLLNRQVAAFLRAHPPAGLPADALGRALDILESPWPRRDEALLRAAFRDRADRPAARAARLVTWVLGTGLEPARPPPPLPPIAPEDVRLVCWMALEAA